MRDNEVEGGELGRSEKWKGNAEIERERVELNLAEPSNWEEVLVERDTHYGRERGGGWIDGEEDDDEEDDEWKLRLCGWGGWKLTIYLRQIYDL